MKNVITALLVTTFALGLSSHVRAAGVTFSQKMDVSCKVIADSAATLARKEGGASISQAYEVYGAAKTVCVQSYMQASADYPLAKAKKTAAEKGGNFTAAIVQLSYDAYREDTAGK